MQRGEVWWAELPPPAGKRPVLLISRNKAIQIRQSITVIQITRTIRQIPTEVLLGKEDGMSKTCAINADVLFTIPKSILTDCICNLSPQKMSAVSDAIKFSLALT
ncbi:MAG: type II toxin-antitoxin system PemK/MazF family toxin [Elusimicrobia bacterium]|nr:type II toxin-antitoxin system PemK/MazF family toxin [Elusimicrobiota bacterium]